MSKNSGKVYAKRPSTFCKMSLFTSLRYLVALHQHKHFGRAADACHITQPALSNAIRTLEDEYGTTIVKRGRNFECFTPEGERILASALRVLREQEVLKQEIQSSLTHPVGRLILCAVPTVVPVAARFVGHLQRRYEGIAIVLRSMSSPEIEAGLENLSIDLALGYTQRMKPRVVEIKAVDQYREQYFLLRKSRKHNRGGLRITQESMAWKDAAALPLCLLTPEMHNRTIVDSAFKEAGVSVRPIIETNSILTLGLSVMVGDVYSVLPSAMVGVLRGYGELEAVPLVAPEVVTPIGFMFAHTARPTQALRVALELAKDPEWAAHLALHTGPLTELRSRA